MGLSQAGHNGVIGSWHASSSIRFGLEPDNDAGTTPKFNIVTFDKALGLGNSLSIIATDQRLISDEMPIVPTVYARYSISPESPLTECRPLIRAVSHLQNKYCREPDICIIIINIIDQPSAFIGD
jgi:hypothetical protein